MAHVITIQKHNTIKTRHNLLDEEANCSIPWGTIGVNAYSVFFSLSICIPEITKFAKKRPTNIGMKNLNRDKNML